MTNSAVVAVPRPMLFDALRRLEVRLPDVEKAAMSRRLRRIEFDHVHPKYLQVTVDGETARLQPIVDSNHFLLRRGAIGEGPAWCEIAALVGRDLRDGQVDGQTRSVRMASR